MGILIRAKTANFSSSYISRALALTTRRTNLIAECLFGRDYATSKINSAGDKIDLGYSGTPVYGDYFATLGYAGWLDTNIADQANLTLMGVFNFGSSAASKAIMATTLTVTNGGFVAVSTSSGGLYKGEYTYGASSPYAERVLNLSPSTPISENRAVAYRLSGTTNVVSKLDEFKGGVRIGGVSNTSTDTRPLATTKVAIGSVRGSALTATSNFVALLAWSEALSDADLLSAYQDLYAALGKLGVVS